MGVRGPIGKRSNAQAGHRTKAEKAEVEKVEVDQGPAEMPEPDAGWHPIARDWYVSLSQSGQARFMEPSDWAGARYVAEAVSQNLKGDKFSAMLFSSVWSAMNDLLTTEGARRRVKLEIDRGGNSDDAPAGVAVLDDYRNVAGG